MATGRAGNGRWVGEIKEVAHRGVYFISPARLRAVRHARAEADAEPEGLEKGAVKGKTTSERGGQFDFVRPPARVEGPHVMWALRTCGA